jgi:iron complex outermembrane recepter protein
VRASVAAVLGSAAMLGYAPLVSGAEEGAELEEVQVTGSRIVRRDYESNSPLITVDSERLESKTGLNIENYLNQLPNFNPAASPVTTQGDVQITPVNSVGIASISLRGFGPNRNLVLVDGHRTVPINPLMVTDLNGIPSALVERIEIISGGASAVYGADAIGGVTNFIMRDNFEGFEFDVQGGMAEVGDAEEFRAYAVMGTNFAEGRGNLTMSAEYYEREAAMEVNRSFYTNAWSDPTVGGDFFFFGYNGYAPGTNAPNVNAMNAIFASRPTYVNGSLADNGAPDGPGVGVRTGPGCATFGCVFGYRFGENGKLFTTTGNNLNSFTASGGVIDGKINALQRVYDGTIANVGQQMWTPKWNNDQALTSAPQDRYSIFASGTFDINDNVTFFARGSWNESQTRTLLLPTNASTGWEAAMPYNPAVDSPFRLDSPTSPGTLLDYGDTNLVAQILTNPIYANPGYIPHGATGAQHPVTPDFAALLNSRGRQTYCLTGGVGPTGCPATMPPPATATVVATTNPALVGTFAGYNTNRAQTWILETYPTDSFPQRATLNTNTVWQVETGLRFNLPFGDWTGEAYYAHGESSTYNNAFGNNSLTRWRIMVTQPDYGRNATLESNQPNTSPTPPANIGFGGAIVHCTSGFYDTIFKGDTPATADCTKSVQANLQSRTQNQQNIGELNFQGGLFNLPAGEVRAAAGFQWRENRAQFIPDILQSTSSFADQVIGVYPTGYLDAKTSVKDYYGELLIPVLSDLPFLKKMELELGGRYSDYEDTDSTFTYKVTGNIQFTNWLTLRGGYNRATRAPNLGELFLNEQEIFTIGGANFGDPCSGRSTAPYGAGGAAPDPIIQPATEPPPVLAAGQTPAGANSTYLICQAAMGAVGRDQFYGGPIDPITGQRVPPGVNATTGAGAGFNWILQEGNPNLDSEVADTWSAGFVFQSVSDKPWLSGFQATIDWWKVDISDAIQQYSIDYANYRCYGTNIVSNAADALAQANSVACKNVGRNALTGGQLTSKIAYDNQATISTSGIDIAVNWFSRFDDMGLDSVPGGLGFNMQMTLLDYYKTKQSPLPIDVETDWVGTLGPTLSGTNPGAYEYRLNAGVNYILDNVSVSLRWRHLPPVWGAFHASEEAIIANNKKVANGAPGVKLSYVPSPALQIGSYDVFDLSGSWNINKTLTLRAGVDNIFNREPEVTAASAGRPYDPTKTLAQNAAVLAAVCKPEQIALGCTNPTGYSLATTGAGLTSPGYYDTVGRRYYVGLKARF